MTDSCESGMVWDETCGVEPAVVVVEGSNVDEAAPAFREAPEMPFMMPEASRFEDAAPASACALAMGGVAGTVKSFPSRLDDAEDDGTASPLLAPKLRCDMRMIQRLNFCVQVRQ